MVALRATLGEMPLSLNWSHLRALARGESAIDLRGLALRHAEDARRFVREYGFELDDPHHRAWIRRVHREAVGFLRDTVLEPGEAVLIPPEVAAPADEVELLVQASRYSSARDRRRLWACAVLKVMHVLFYIDNNIKLRHFDAIRRQVFGALAAVLQGDGERRFLTDGELCLPLVEFERKRNKDRHSILLKLLQKPNYVAEDIHDHLGVRLVFETRIECLLALRVLQRAQLLSAINVEAHRVRNNLIDLDLARELLAAWRPRLRAARRYPLDLLRRIDAELLARGSPVERANNPHSASAYRSIQLTVRKLIRLAEPVLVTAEPPPDADPSSPLQAGADGEVSFYFSYELQLMDRGSREAIRSGPASHEEYKRRQRVTARGRVLGTELEHWLAQRAGQQTTTAAWDAGLRATP